jgi:hypothetical protein
MLLPLTLGIGRSGRRGLLLVAQGVLQKRFPAGAEHGKGWIPPRVLTDRRRRMPDIAGGMDPPTGVDMLPQTEMMLLRLAPKSAQGRHGCSSAERR